MEPPSRTYPTYKKDYTVTRLTTRYPLDPLLNVSSVSVPDFFLPPVSFSDLIKE